MAKANSKISVKDIKAVETKYIKADLDALTGSHFDLAKEFNWHLRTQMVINLIALALFGVIIFG